MLIAFSISRWTPLALALLLGVGCGSTTYLAVNNTLLQTNATSEMRGRVMSVFFLNRGLVPLGTMFGGVLARYVGAPLTVSVMGAVVVVLALVLTLRVPVLRQLP
jgi:MFS family permease